MVCLQQVLLKITELLPLLLVLRLLFGFLAVLLLCESIELTSDGYWAEAARDSGGKNRFVVAGITNSTGVFSTNASGLPNLQVTIPGGRTLDQATLNDYGVHFIGIQGDNIRDKITGFKLDGKYDVDLGIIHSVQIGGSFTNRRKEDVTLDNSNTTCCNFTGAGSVPPILPKA